MELLIENNVLTREITYMLKISHRDFVTAKTRGQDHRLFVEACEAGAISDKILALETLARRIEEGT